ncbi:MAG: hypothetical protein JWM10_3763 [Myxococcaceae bacterium]|nr:hypothetical protein [Myxococcaceae bacterium]
MSKPIALVTITLRRVLGLTPALLGSTRDAYFVIRVDNRWVGRTARVDPAAAELALGASPEFTFAVRRGGPTDVTVQAVLYDDRGDTHALVHDLSVVVPFPWTDGPRVLGADGGVQVDCVVATQRYPAQSPPKVPRGSAGVKSGATLVLPHVLHVELTEILGLYQPVSPSPASNQRSSMAVPGYTSDDHRGRVFINADLTGAFKKDVQLIQLTATVTAEGGPIPPGAKLLWTVFEPDNPANTWLRPGSAATPNVHQQWGPLLDAGDYTSFGKSTALGPTGNDPDGTFDHDPVWEQVGPYALDARNPGLAATAIVGGRSAVTLHCRNVGGERFTVTADVENPAPAQAFAARTGVMTMWKRVDLRYLRMDGAADLPVAGVPPALEPACVQMDLAPARATKKSPQHLTKGEKTFDAELGPFVESEFDDADKRGWFCLIAAKEPYKVAISADGKKPPPLYTGDCAIGHLDASREDTVEIAITSAMTAADVTALTTKVAAVVLSWEEPAGTARSAYFDVFSMKRLRKPVDRVQFRLFANDVVPEFTPGDGSISGAYTTQAFYYPRGRDEGGAWHPGGYRVPTTTPVKVISAAGAAYVSGVSPGVHGKDAKGKVIKGANGKPEEYFAGRTVIFTQHRHYWDHNAKPPALKPGMEDELLGVIIHELTHAFGNPHKCGYFDFLVPREKTCCMNYFNTWIIDPAHEVIAGTDGRTGFELCGRHIWSIRKTHLEDNPGLAWK